MEGIVTMAIRRDQVRWLLRRKFRGSIPGPLTRLLRFAVRVTAYRARTGFLEGGLLSGQDLIVFLSHLLHHAGFDWRICSPFWSFHSRTVQRGPFPLNASLPIVVAD
jgi:hypothetical protein